MHTQIYRLTSGVIGHRFPGSPPVLLLDHTGARSGSARTTPLLYVEDPPNVVIVASKGGHRRHPAWYHNLLAHPSTEVQIGSQRRQVRARVATEAERERLWPMAVRTYSGYKGYQERTDRQIPVVILEPAESAATRNGSGS